VHPHGDASPSPKAGASPKANANTASTSGKTGKPGTGATNGNSDGTGSSKGKLGGQGKGTGGGKGDGHEGGGATETQFAWYHLMLKDRFYARWDQPLSQEGQQFATLITIKIDRSGHITDARMAKTSGNATMDASALAAAQKVTQVDPLPKGLGDSEGYEVTIEFKLNQ